MLERYAVIDASNRIINVIAWDGVSDIVLGEGEYAVKDDLNKASPGGAYRDNNFIPPRPSDVPSSVTPLQMRRALRAAGLLAAIQQFILTQPEEVTEAWEYATSIERDNELIALAVAGLGLTDEQCDNIFRLAGGF